jgi:hypothetical protein
MKIVKVEKNDTKNFYVTEDTRPAITDLETLFGENCEVGDSFTFTVVEISDADYESIEDFPGW